MAVYGYVRVSTMEQANQGQSLETQRAKVALQARMMDASIDRVFSDRGVSGSRPLEERPAGKALLEAVRAGDSVIATKLDRMFRSAGDALSTLQAFKANGVKLYLLDLGGDDCTSNGISGLVFTIMSAVAQFERERTAERIADVKASQKAKGRFLGGQRAPFGYRVGADGGLIENLDEQETAYRMQQLRSQGVSLRGIAALLEKETGQAIHPQSVKRILNSSYIYSKTSSRPIE
ncbi:serine recombinase PinR [Thalassobaculum fulvum]|uniref:Serine recombinase PinR n=1 Tax=Thalassobaculum fulvum TaxID=1633335 RepID=A0A919CML7_9PROT|nr:recombinase family protein [Thalassobaculum fulvum]GHD41061.1 serine recombinase PinR [Thalassobaculum fulvum]